MPTDPVRGACVAWFALLVGCGPTVRPGGPADEPTPVLKTHRPRPASAGGRQVMIGELCPQGAAGRPAVMPLMIRTVAWTDKPEEVANVVERGAVPRFSVYGVDGKVAGRFDTLGTADIGLSQPVASGTYVGALPCTADAGKGARTEDPRCVPATAGCGLALSELAQSDDPVTSASFVTGGACVSGDALAIDVDGDGVMESFPLAAVLDGTREPAEEWSAAPTAGAACKPTFQVYDIKLAAPADGNKPPDPKQVVKLVVLGVVDVDSDGRLELVLAFEFPTVRTIVVYSANSSSLRLELAGESTSFPR
ncbi:MAG: hypothetical protein WKG01_27720 [Kofleriaceae bacterium]